jgi:hypothetical protein
MDWSVLIWFTVYRMTHGRDMLGAAAADGLQCTMQLVVETRWFFYDMVYSVKYNTIMIVLF